MKTDANARHQPVASQLPPPTRERAAPADPLATLGDDLRCAGRWARQAASDLASLFDPLQLLEEPAKPLRTREVEQLSQASTRMEHSVSNSDFDAKQFASMRGTLPAQVSPSVSMSHLALDPDTSEPPPASLHTIAASRLEEVGFLPALASGANRPLADRMVPPAPFSPFKSGQAAQSREARVTVLTELIDKSLWQTVAAGLPNGSAPQALVQMLGSALAPTVQTEGVQRDSKHTMQAAVDSLLVHPDTRRPAGGATPMALQSWPHLRAAGAVGSTYHAGAEGDRMDCQDGSFLTEHMTVTVDGLGGHGPMAPMVRMAVLAVGRYVCALGESIASTQRYPAQFLYDHCRELVCLLDRVVRSAIRSPFAEKQRSSDDISARAAFIAVARFNDGVVVFGVGDCTALVQRQGAQGRLDAYTPQAQAHDMFDSHGLGQGTVTPAQCLRHLYGGANPVARVILGTDGVFDSRQGHLELVDGATPDNATGAKARVGKATLAAGSPEDSCEALITPLTRSSRAHWERLKDASDPQERAKARVGLDDVALVVRDLGRSSGAATSGADKAGAPRKDGKGADRDR